MIRLMQIVGLDSYLLLNQARTRIQLNYDNIEQYTIIENTRALLLSIRFNRAVKLGIRLFILITYTLCTSAHQKH